jgi:hypothetical protein
MKKILLLTCLVAGSAVCIGQKFIFNIGPELAIPGGKDYGLKRTAGTGVGGSIRAELLFSQHCSIITTVGYLSFGEQEDEFSGTPPTTTKVHAIPIQAGIKYYIKKITEPVNGIFVSAETGFMPTTTHFDYAVSPDSDFKESGFTAAIGSGYQHKSLEAGFRLQYNLTASGLNIYYFNFRVAYGFSSGKR